MKSPLSAFVVPETSSQYTITTKGTHIGTYVGNTEQEALDAMAKAHGYADLAAHDLERNLVVTDHTVTKA